MDPATIGLLVGKWALAVGVPWVASHVAPWIAKKVAGHDDWKAAAWQAGGIIAGAAATAMLGGDPAASGWGAAIGAGASQVSWQRWKAR